MGQSSHTVVQTEWWLMEPSLPDLNWARLRCYADGTADVFDCDARLSSFTSIEDAILFLEDDEFLRLTSLTDLLQDDPELPFPPDRMTPPRADSDADLGPLMYQRWHSTLNAWRPR